MNLNALFLCAPINQMAIDRTQKINLSLFARSFSESGTFSPHKKPASRAGFVFESFNSTAYKGPIVHLTLLGLGIGFHPPPPPLLWVLEHNHTLGKTTRL